MKLKALAAALAFGLAAQANAAINPGDAAPTLTGYGELFFTAYDAASQKSYTLDLGVDMEEFITSGQTTLQTWTTSVLAEFDPSALSSLEWNIAAGTQSDGFDSQAQYSGFISTAAPGQEAVALTSNYFQNAIAAAQSAANHVKALDPTTDYAIDGDYTASGTNDGSYGAPIWGNNMGGQSAFTNANTGLGTEMAAFWVGVDTGSPTFDTIVEEMGGATGLEWTFKLLEDGSLEYSAVPVPAAIWLLASSLIGFVGVARRRKTA